MKTKMKKTRKLIPAIAMLLVSLIVMSSASFAWFSMNKQVTATGMQVTAKSNATYLLIGDDSTKAANDKQDLAGAALTNTHAANYATTGNVEKTCYPTAYYADAGTLNGHTTAAGKWYTTSSDKQNLAVSGTGAITEVTLGDGKYMLTYKMYLTLSKDSEAYTGKVTITPDFIAADAAIKAYVTINSENIVFDSNETPFTTTGDVTINSSEAVEVVAYVYVDGNSTNVNSEYVAGGNTITGQLNLQFDLVD